MYTFNITFVSTKKYDSMEECHTTIITDTLSACKNVFKKHFKQCEVKKIVMVTDDNKEVILFDSTEKKQVTEETETNKN